VIAIYSAAYCRGSEVADLTASELGYRLVADDIYELAGAEFGVSAAKMEKAATTLPPFWDKITHQQDRLIAQLGLTLAKLLESEEILIHGSVIHLIPQSVHHGLRVCLGADLEYRVAVARESNECSEADTEYGILLQDERSAAWTRTYLGIDPCSSNLYDLVIPMHTTTVEEAVATICRSAREESRLDGAQYQREVADFLLAATVNVLLVEGGHSVKVTASDGDVEIRLNEYVTRLQHYQSKLETLVRQVPGVRSVSVSPGTGFVPPSLTPTVDIDMPSAPSKVLLVDDERDFVHSLSERLEVRDFPSSVVYDGTEALSFLEHEEAEVMVLDLKMPGVDGIEVLRRVKRDHPDVEVIILTGHGSEREERLSRQLGAFAYLQKPLDIDELTKVMKQAYARIARRKLRETTNER
jgi:CheY-like chemotaxis protein